MKNQKPITFGKDKRREHKDWQVTLYYRDSEKFARVYTDHEKASRFGGRQKKSPVVRMARVTQVS